MSNTLPKDAEEEMLRLELRLQLLSAHEESTTQFLSFCKYVWPEMIVGEHHRIIAKALDRVVSGECKRLMIAMPPRHGKSQMGSYLFPAYLMGRRPDAKLIVGSHTAELAQRFGRMIRNLVDHESYKELFPDMKLAADSKAAGRWATAQGGEAFFIGKGGAMTGRGGDMVTARMIYEMPIEFRSYALAWCASLGYQSVSVTSNAKHLRQYARPIIQLHGCTSRSDDEICGRYWSA